jgi:hypothetical protein
MSPLLTRYTPPVVGAPGQHAAPIGNDHALWPLKKQVTTIAFGDDDDGTYTIRVTLQDGRYVDVSFVADSSASPTALAAAAAVALNADLEMGSLLVATSAIADLILTFKALGVPYGVSFPSNPSTNMVATLTTDPEVAALPLGIGVVRVAGTPNTIRQPESGDTAQDISALVIRSAAEILPLQAGYVQADGYAAGKMVPLADQGDYWVDVEDAVTADQAAYCRVVATGLEIAGSFRSDADGGDAVLMTGVHFVTSTAGKGRAIVRLKLPNLPDGSVGAAQLEDESITPAAMSYYYSDELTSTGAAQSHAHGLGRTPVIVIPFITELPADLAGGADIALGTHTGTNVVLTVGPTTTVKYRIFAM